ncbi:MAG: glutathione synthase [Gammaproteobacteria bacterium]|nr:glutathione synthase [Gammaproteobacteria bacterium]
MSRKLGVVMDPIESINYKKDTSLALLEAAQRFDFELHYMEMRDLALRDGRCVARQRPLQVRMDPEDWFTLGDPELMPLAELDVILMRKDPPFDPEYIYATYMLERAEQEGVLVVNKPRSLRDANEKMFTAFFPQCCPPTLVSRDHKRLKDFLVEHEDIVIKPLDGMGGSSIFRVQVGGPNVNVIMETLTQHQTRFAMAQRFIPEIVRGDKRVLMIDGQPTGYALARVPQADDMRGNLAAGAVGEAREMTERDHWIAAQVGPELKRRGLVFVGLDVIGDYLTEINVTSPTCVRELNEQIGLDIGATLMEAILRRLEDGGAQAT